MLTQADQIDHQHPEFNGNEGKVDALHQRPDRQVGLVGRHEGVAPLLDRVGAFHDGQRRQQAGQVDGGEDGLVGDHAGYDGALGAFEDDVALEKAEPGGGGRAEDGWSTLA